MFVIMLQNELPRSLMLQIQYKKWLDGALNRMEQSNLNTQKKAGRYNMG